MTDRELIQQALEALDAYSWEQVQAATTALRERLAQPQMEPCAGRNCGSTNPNLHSAECFEDYEKSTGMNQWQGRACSGVLDSQTEGEEHMSRKAMQVALEALESDPISHAGLVNRKQAITALRQALETKQEPVALPCVYITSQKDGGNCYGDGTVYRGQRSKDSETPTLNLQSTMEMWERAYEQVCEERDAIVKDSNKAYELLRWAETEMRYAKWGTRLNDQHGRTDVYTAIVEFLK